MPRACFLLPIRTLTFSVIFKINKLKKSPIEVAQKIFSSWVKTAKRSWIKELEVIHTRLSCLEEWSDKIEKMKRNWCGMVTNPNATETVEKKQLKTLINEEMFNEAAKKLKRTVSNYNWKDANCWSQDK